MQAIKAIKNMKKVGKIVLSLLLFAVLTVFCPASPAFAANKELVVTYVKAPLNIPSIIGKHLQLLEEEFGPLGYTVSHPEITSGAMQSQAMAAGSVQVANCIGGTSLLLAASQGLDIRIAGIYSRAPKTFSLLVMNPEIQTIADLKGRQVGGPKGTVLHQLLLAGLIQAGIPAADVGHIDMGIPTAVAALLSGSIDGALAAGPAALSAVENGARVLFDGEGLIEGTTLIGISGDALNDIPDLAERMLRAHRKALAYANENPEESMKIIAEEVGITPDQVKEMMEFYDFDPEIRETDIEDLNNTMAFLLDAELAEKSVEPASLIVR